MRVELHASTTTPYVGQLVELTLRITGKPPDQAVVEIPWLTATPTRWTWHEPLQHWTSRQAQASSGSLSLRWQGKALFMPQTAAGVFEWRWKFFVREVGEDEAIRFTAVQVGAASSQPLVMEVKRPPLVASSPGVWNLGVGVYSATTAWESPRTVLGQENTLSVTVTGQGDLTKLPAPNLAALPGWDRDAFLIERLPDAPGATARVFRYSVRPRRLGTIAPPGLVMRWFDPVAETVQTRSVSIPPLEVGSARDETARSTPGQPVYLEDARAALPRELAAALTEHEGQHSPALFRWTGLLMMVPYFCLFVIVVQWELQRTRPAWWERRRRRRVTHAAAWHFSRVATPPHARAVLADWLAVLLEQPPRLEFESLAADLKSTGHSERFMPLLQAVQAWEFGPASPHTAEHVRTLAQQLLRQETLA